LHATHTIDALNAGFHVLCEKPMAIKSADASLMLAAAANNKKQLFIVKQNRFNPPVKALKKLLSENRLGKIYSAQLTCIWSRPESYYKDSSWKGTKELDGGTLFTQFSHFIDILYWYFGDIEIVSAIVKNAAHQLIEFEDEGGVLFTTESGITGTIHYSVNSWKNNIEGSLLIVGEKGTVKIGGQYLNTLEYQNIEDYRIEELPTGNPANNYGAYQGSMSNHGAVYDNLIATLNGIEPIATGGYEAGKTVSIIETIYQKAIQL
jgi:UDP-N-acetyl-2-amino-2-deoxyglucuronate dehydrogenase